jgi:3-oxoacid CoA-transferase
MARSAKITIVEAEHIVEPGELDPASIHVPGIYVDRVVQSTEEKQIEKYTFAKEPTEQPVSTGSGDDALVKREKIVKRAAKEFKNGMYANLGIGMPMLAPNFLPSDVSVTLQSGISPRRRCLLQKTVSLVLDHILRRVKKILT